MSETSARLAGWAPSEPLRKDGLTGDSLPQEGWSVKDWEVQKHVSVTDRGRYGLIRVEADEDGRRIATILRMDTRPGELVERCEALSAIGCEAYVTRCYYVVYTPDGVLEIEPWDWAPCSGCGGRLVPSDGLASDCGRWYCCGWCLSLSRAPSVRRRMHRSVARECAEYEQTAEGAV